MADLAARGGFLASASDDRTVKVWTMPERQGLRTLPQEGYATLVEFSPDASRLAVGSVEGFEVWDLQTWRRIHTAPEKPTAIAWEGAILAVASQGSAKIQLLDGGTFQPRGELVGHHDTVHALALSGDGANLLSGSKDRTARMWDTGSGVQLQVYVGHRGPVLSTALGPTGAIATGSADKTAIVWHAVSGEPVRQLAGHKDWVTAVTFEPTGLDALLTSSTDGTVRFWNLSTGVPLDVLEPEAGPLEDLVFIGDRVLVAGAALDEHPIGDALEGREPLKIRQPDIDTRCEAIVTCAKALFESGQLDASATWSVVTRARELSAEDPRSCRDLDADLRDVDGDRPEACAAPP